MVHILSPACSIAADKAGFFFLSKSTDIFKFVSP